MPERSVLTGRCLAVVLAMMCTVAGAGTAALASSAHLPPAPRTPHERAAIEGFAPDQAEFFCRKSVEAGVKAFERLVLRTYQNTASDGDLRACDDGGSSEHKDGRAWDWGVDHRIAKQRADGKSMLHWLFATDSHGNKDAMFRRLGLMYVIWDKRIWGSWSRSWQPYACSGPTLCHLNHMHFSFGWAGAEKKTSYWTGKVSRVVEPPLPRFTKLHGHRTLRVTAKRGSAAARWLFKGGDRYRVLASGLLRHGRTVVADARCVKTSSGWASDPSGVSITGDQLQSWDEHWMPVHDNGHGCNTATHTYWLVLTPASSSTVIGALSGDSGDSGAIRLGFTRTG